jgi:hypothetical protein
MITRRQRIKRFRRWLKFWQDGNNADHFWTYRNYVRISNAFANDFAKALSLRLDIEAINGRLK